MKRLVLVLLMAGVFFPAISYGQDGQNSVRYTNLAQQFISTNLNGDANANILPSVATQNGFGSFLDNPASMGLIKLSYFNTGVNSNYSNQENLFRGSSLSDNNSNSKFGNIGIVYSVPTNQGSLVIGGGYTLNNQINRINALDAYNISSSITDAFKNENSDYNSIAFKSYAIDYGDVEQTYLESIFRIGFAPGEFLGIQQQAEIKQNGNSGEFSIFMASEVQKNLFVGASIGITSGNYSYNRNFLEVDVNNRYDGDFVDADNDGNGGTDVNDVLVEDSFNSEMVGANVRAGIIYKILPNVNIAASIFIPGKLIVTENYSSMITTRLDDGRTPFSDEFSGSFSYAINRPNEYKLGLAVENISRFTFSSSIEMIDYRNTQIDLTRDEDLDFREIADLRVQETVFDSVFSTNYRQIMNLKGGLKYTSKTGFELRGGAALLPGKSSVFTADRVILSGGLGIPLSSRLYLDITSQYINWNDRSILYEYTDTESGEFNSESIDETISQYNVMFSVKYRF